MNKHKRRDFRKHKKGPAAPQASAPVEGVLQRKGKVGFVLSEDPKHGDILIAGPTLRLAMDGDRVRARLTSPPNLKPGERRTGEITEVLTHARSTAVGAFQRVNNIPVLAPEDDAPMIHLTDLKSFVPHIGDWVTARILTWPTPEKPATGELIEVLGARDTPGMDLKLLIRKYELPDAFPPEVSAQADAFGSTVPESAWQAPGRRTFFDQRVFTIDGADAKDFDDAVSLERRPNGWRLGVHIADVAHYVKEGTPLDEEAIRRSTSVYLSGTVIPMLPFPLSDNLCSLRPDEIRLTLTCLMDISPEGDVTHADIMESAIKSARRFTYQEVDSLLKGETVERVTPEIAADVREMGTLAKLLRAKRFGRGSLDFDFPEPEIYLDAKGRPSDIRKRERLESHRLIEDFMLAANEAVARHMQTFPFLYRIHETPDPLKLEKLKQSMDVLGVKVPRHLNPKQPEALQHIVKASSGLPIQPLVHLMVLRSLKQAVYSPTNKGHFGLASACYTHFTSPIRRYPDLLVHRMIKERLTSQYRRQKWELELPAITARASRRERVAVDAEREYLDIQKARLMEPFVGQEFTGFVSSVTNFGIFVQLDRYFVEGLVHITNLPNDYFMFDEARMVLRGKRSGRMFSMGQKVKVQLAKADPIKHQLDFELLSSEQPARPAHAGPASAHPQRPSHPAKQGRRQRHRRRR